MPGWASSIAQTPVAISGEGKSGGNPCCSSRERSSSRRSAGGWLTKSTVLVWGVGQSVALGGGPSRNPYRAEDDGYAGMAELADATDLKVRAAIRRNTMFPPAVKGWKHPAPPVPRPRTCPPPHLSRLRRAPTAPLKLSCLKPYTSGVSSALDTRAWRNGRRSGLEGNLSARRETGDAELPKFGEPCHMAIPSQARPEPSSREGVETRRAAPNPGSAGHGEGIVQTANPASAPGRRKP